MTIKIVGRVVEKERLEEALNSHRSELIAIYGRRRIGKTYLIREYYHKYITFSFSGLRNGTRPDQIENFMIELQNVSGKFQREKPKNWLQAFNILKNILVALEKQKKRK